MKPTPQELARVIDHTLLKPDATPDAVRQLCAEAQEFGFYAVCVQPCWTRLAANLLRDGPTQVATVIGFPHGVNRLETKVFEAERALEDGAHELDMVINIGKLKAGDWNDVFTEIEALSETRSPESGRVKVILECASLTEDEKRRAADIAAQAGAFMVKTSTGFGPGGATEADVALLRAIVGARCGVKAAGGIRDLKTALSMLEVGADRLGTSAGVEILRQCREE